MTSRLRIIGEITGNYFPVILFLKSGFEKFRFDKITGIYRKIDRMVNFIRASFESKKESTDGQIDLRTTVCSINHMTPIRNPMTKIIYNL